LETPSINHRLEAVTLGGFGRDAATEVRFFWWLTVTAQLCAAPRLLAKSERAAPLTSLAPKSVSALDGTAR